MDSGRLAYLVPSIEECSINISGESANLTLKVKVKNSGTALAITGLLTVDSDDATIQSLDTLAPGDIRTTSLFSEAAKPKPSDTNGNFEVNVECFYSTPEGHSIADIWKIHVFWIKHSSRKLEPTEYVVDYESKKYYGANGLRLTVHQEE